MPRATPFFNKSLIVLSRYIYKPVLVIVKELSNKVLSLKKSKQYDFYWYMIAIKYSKLKNLFQKRLIGLIITLREILIDLKFNKHFFSGQIVLVCKALLKLLPEGTSPFFSYVKMWTNFNLNIWIFSKHSEKKLWIIHDSKKMLFWSKSA